MTSLYSSSLCCVILLGIKSWWIRTGSRSDTLFYPNWETSSCRVDWIDWRWLDCYNDTCCTWLCPIQSSAISDCNSRKWDSVSSGYDTTLLWPRSAITKPQPRPLSSTTTLIAFDWLCSEEDESQDWARILKNYGGELAEQENWFCILNSEDDLTTDSLWLL